MLSVAAPPQPPAQRRAGESRERVAVFLGAGASYAFGYPLTKQLLPELIEAAKKKRVRSWDHDLGDDDFFVDALRELLPGVDTIPKDELPLITDILTLVDHALASGSALLRERHTDDLRRFRGLLERGVAFLVGPGRGINNEMVAQRSRICDWLLTTAQSHRLGVVTTNYDIEVERGLYDRLGTDRVADDVDFGMSWRDPGETESVIYDRPPDPKLSFYKLHGSLNWLRCPMCEYVYVNVLGSVVDWAWVPEKSDFNTCHCLHWPLQSMLVSPSYVRDTREANLLGIWRQALTLFADADRWLIAGYSVPPEDIAIRTILMKAHRIRAAMPGRKPLQIFAAQGPGDEERRRCIQLFPELGVKGHYHAGGLQSFDLAQVLA